MFNLGDYYYSKKHPIWIEIIDTDSHGVGFMAHRIDKGDVKKDWWTAMSLPIPFDKYFTKADSEGEARIKAFETYCKNNLQRFKEDLVYIVEPLVETTIKIKQSDLKHIQGYIKEN